MAHSMSYVHQILSTKVSVAPKFTQEALCVSLWYLCTHRSHPEHPKLVWPSLKLRRFTPCLACSGNATVSGRKQVVVAGVVRIKQERVRGLLLQVMGLPVLPTSPTSHR